MLRIGFIFLIILIIYSCGNGERAITTVGNSDSIITIDGSIGYQTIIGGGTSYSGGGPYPIPIDDVVMQTKALGFRVMRMTYGDCKF